MHALYQTKNSEVVLVRGQCCGLDQTPSLIEKKPERLLQRSSQETKQTSFKPPNLKGQLHYVPVKGGSEVELWGCCGHARLSHARLVTCDFHLDVVTQHNRLADFLVHTKEGSFCKFA